MALQSRAASKASKSQQNAMNRQTELGAGEFDNRMASAREGDKRTSELIDTGFAERQALEDTTYRANYDASTGKIVRDTGATDEYFGGLGSILDEQGQGHDSAREEYNRIVDEERARQAAFRGEADTTVDALIAGSGSSAFNTDRDKAIAGRGALAQFMAGNIALPQAYRGASPLITDTATRMSSGADTRAGMDTARRAAIEAYTDAGKAAATRQAGGRESLAITDMQAKNSAAKLPYQLNPSQLKYGNTGERATEARNLAGNDLEGKLKMSASEFQRSTVPLNQYASNIDAALADYYRSRLSGESDYATGVIGTSQRYEDTNRGLTDYKISNTRGVSPLGDLMAGFGGQMVGAGMGSGMNLGSFDDPFDVVPSSGMGPQMPQSVWGQLVY